MKGSITIKASPRHEANSLMTPVVFLIFLLRHYYYEKEAMVYGFYEDGNWKFGLKDRGRNNGYAIKMNSLDALYVENSIAKYPL